MLTEHGRRRLTERWGRTPRGKLICPECGLTGWPGGSWIDKHQNHSTAPCGRVVSDRGLPNHTGRCPKCAQEVDDGST